MKIAITTSSFGEFDSAPLTLLQNAHIEYILNPFKRTITEEEATLLFQDCDAVIAGTEPLTEKVMSANPLLKVISRCGVGVDNIDKVAASKNNIKVFCTPNAPTRATAEQTLTLIMCLLRHTAHMAEDMHQGKWKKRMGNLIFEKKVGIIGYGRIGSTVGMLLKSLGCQIACYDPFVPYSDCPKMEFDEILSWADIITLHCSKDKNAPPLINKQAFMKMQKGSWFINAARGDLVDEEALLEVLTSGHLAGAALDVFAQEPYKGPLLQISNALLTPHASSYAKEARIIQEIQSVTNVLIGLGLKSEEHEE